MDKTLAYWIEKLCGISIASILTFLCYKYWIYGSFITSDNFFDKLITICTTLFGFLLTVLTLIIQSNSQTILNMKNHGSYLRLIKFNKTIVILSAVVCILSLLIYFVNDKFEKVHGGYVKYSSLLNLFLFVWMLLDTLIFVLIFYKIILTDSKN